MVSCTSKCMLESNRKFRDNTNEDDFIKYIKLAMLDFHTFVFTRTVTINIILYILQSTLKNIIYNVRNKGRAAAFKLLVER